MNSQQAASTPAGEAQKTSASAAMTLTESQQAVVDGMEAFLRSRFDPEKPDLLLKGYAGTGKTFCIRALIPTWGRRLVFTAPTNKATRVLREILTSDSFRPECRTTYSVLGLKLDASGELKELKEPDDPIDLSDYVAVVVDEGSMVNSQLYRVIKRAQREYRIKFIFMGDPCQIPPVKEEQSPIWDIETGFELTKVMRYDNDILKLATAIRSVVNDPFPAVRVFSQHNEEGTEGVFRMGKSDFDNEIRDHATAGRFMDPVGSKAISWRNATVDTYNRLIRGEMFGNDSRSPWLLTDRAIFLEPAKNLDDEIIAHTDDEGVIVQVREDEHPAHKEFRIFRLTLKLDSGKVVPAFVLHPQSTMDYEMRVEQLAAAAKLDRRKWYDFWLFKESFHKVRHAYAITAHRSQGSTYEDVFVDRIDILMNQNRQEAFRCLYVACTRAKKRVFTL